MDNQVELRRMKEEKRDKQAGSYKKRGLKWAFVTRGDPS